MSSNHQGSEERINIAIDGPAGAGKSTVARKVAAQLGYIYIDTGAMYRAVTLSGLRADIDLQNSSQLAEHAADIQIKLEPGPEGQLVFLDGEEVTNEIRSRDINLNVSVVAANEFVRKQLASNQKVLAAHKGVVMDGRDIGSNVLPEAELKIFLTASVQERALRRHRENDMGIDLEQLEAEIAARDKMDQEREFSPLIMASDAVLMDSTSMSIDDVVHSIVALGRTKLAGEK